MSTILRTLTEFNQRRMAKASPTEQLFHHLAQLRSMAMESYLLLTAYFAARDQAAIFRERGREPQAGRKLLAGADWRTYGWPALVLLKINVEMKQIRKCPIEQAQKAVGRRRSTAGMQLGISFVRYLTYNGLPSFHGFSILAQGVEAQPLRSATAPDWWTRVTRQRTAESLCSNFSAAADMDLTWLVARSSAPLTNRTCSPRLSQLPEHPAPTFAPSDMALSLSAHSSRSPTHRATPGTRSLSGQSSPPAAR
jgi:hypothetical protein